jgi:hypothetical protein
MSLNNILSEHVETTINTFISNIADKYDLSADELRELWYGGVTKSVKSTKTKPALKQTKIASVDMEDLSPARLSKSTLVELKALCKSKGLKVSGKKDELISRLTGSDEVADVSETKATKGKALAKSPKGKTITKGKPSAPVLEKLTSSAMVIPVRRNKYDNYEHPQTHLVLNPKTRKVYGKQQDDGTVSELTDDDIEQCKKYKFEYILPGNLDTGNENVEIDELDEEEEVEDDVIEDDVIEDKEVEDDEEEVEEIEDDE